MKHFNILSVTLVILLLGSCQRVIQEPDIVWGQFPYDRFFSYPESMKKGVKFVSQNNEELVFTFNDYNVKKEFMYAHPLGTIGYGFRASTGEVLYFDMNSTGRNFSFLGEVYNRYYLGISFEVNRPPVKQEARFEVVVPYDSTDYMPYDPELIATYLTDTIDMVNDYGKKVAKLVVNEGIISFVDKRGVLWQREK